MNWHSLELKPSLITLRNNHLITKPRILGRINNPTGCQIPLILILLIASPNPRIIGNIPLRFPNLPKPKSKLITGRISTIWRVAVSWVVEGYVSGLLEFGSFLLGLLELGRG